MASLSVTFPLCRWFIVPILGQLKGADAISIIRATVRFSFWEKILGPKKVQIFSGQGCRLGLGSRIHKMFSAKRN
jgi:hypothetical protein